MAEAQKSKQSKQIKKLCNSAFVSFQQKNIEKSCTCFLFFLIYTCIFPQNVLRPPNFGMFSKILHWGVDRLWHIVQRIVRGPQEAAGHAMRRSCCGRITAHEATRQGQLQSRLAGCLRKKEGLKVFLRGWNKFFCWTEAKNTWKIDVSNIFVHWNILSCHIKSFKQWSFKPKNIKL